MALKMPWMQFQTRDWLDSKELRRCSPISRGILADLMALAHEGTPYGYLADDIGPLSDEFIASRLFVPLEVLRHSILELVRFGRLHQLEGKFYIKRMVDDEAGRQAKVKAGKSGGNPKLVKVVVNHDSSRESGDGGLTEGQPPSDSDSDSKKKVLPFKIPNSSGDWTGADKFETAWDRHKKHRGKNETYETVAGVLIGMEIDWVKFEGRHVAFCEHWDGKDWDFCPLTLLEWVQNKMPLPNGVRARDSPGGGTSLYSYPPVPKYEKPAEFAE